MGIRCRVAVGLAALLLTSCLPQSGPTPAPDAPTRNVPSSVPPMQAASAPLPTATLAIGKSPASAQPSTAAPSPAPVLLTPTGQPAIVTVSPRSTAPPAAPMPDAGCGSGPPPSSLDTFPTQSTTVYAGQTYHRVGRDLVVDLQMVDSEGTTEGADLVSIRAESCTIADQLRYDWIYTEYFALRCPQSLADFGVPASGPWGVSVVGRRFHLDGRLVELEGGTSDDTGEEKGDCAGKRFRYVVYWTGGTPTPVPEGNTLHLLGSELAALAGWITWQRRQRTRI